MATLTANNVIKEASTSMVESSNVANKLTEPVINQAMSLVAINTLAVRTEA